MMPGTTRAAPLRTSADVAARSAARKEAVGRDGSSQQQQEAAEAQASRTSRPMLTRPKEDGIGRATEQRATTSCHAEGLCGLRAPSRIAPAAVPRRRATHRRMLTSRNVGHPHPRRQLGSAQGKSEREGAGRRRGRSSSISHAQAERVSALLNYVRCKGSETSDKRRRRLTLRLDVSPASTATARSPPRVVDDGISSTVQQMSAGDGHTRPRSTGCPPTPRALHCAAEGAPHGVLTRRRLRRRAAPSRQRSAAKLDGGDARVERNARGGGRALGRAGVRSTSRARRSRCRTARCGRGASGPSKKFAKADAMAETAAARARSTSTSCARSCARTDEDETEHGDSSAHKAERRPHCPRRGAEEQAAAVDARKRGGRLGCAR